MKFARFDHRVFLFHVLFWVIYFIFNAYLWETFDKTYNETTFYGLTRLPVKIISVYLNYYLLIQFFFRKKYFAFFAFFILNLIVAGLIQTYISTPANFNSQSFTQFSLPVCSVVIVSSVLVIIHQFFIKVNESKQMEIEKIKSELNFLKTQLQPHFLFNTLNNIYSFIINDSNDATEALKKLSTLLRYIIYECDQPLVQLEKELKMIRDYIDLEKIRYGKNFNMSLQVQGNASNKMISPLLLIPFLENSFKHGASQMLTHPWINLDITILEHELEFILSNSKPAIAGEKTISNGLGLRNVKKRLSILYKDTHALNITDDIMSFSVSLKVPIFQSNEDVYEFSHEVKAYELV